MARSVSIPYNAEWVMYVDISEENDFDFLIEIIQEAFSNRFKSLTECNDWIGRENLIILENQYANIGISEYNGILAIWSIVNDASYEDYTEGLAQNWLSQIEVSVRNIVSKMFSNVLIPLGTFSNGEQCFRINNNPGSMYTSKEGLLW